MQAQNQVERITLDAPEAIRPWLARPQPVIFTNLFQGEPVEIVDAARFRQQFSTLPIHCSKNYVNRILTAALDASQIPASDDRRPCTVEDYFGLMEREPDTDFLVTEFPTPPEVGPIFRVPELIRSIPGSGPIGSKMFLANAGNASDLHFDWHGRSVLLYQAFGRKRAILFPPESARKLVPLEIWSTIKLRSFSEPEKADFIRYAHGSDCVLHPGETLFLPPFIWHHLEYIDRALSFNLMFGTVNEPARFILKNCHRDRYAQAILVRMLADHGEGPWSREAFARIRDACETSYPSPRVKYLTIRKLMRGFFADTDHEYLNNDQLWIDFGQLFADNPSLYRVYVSAVEN